MLGIFVGATKFVNIAESVAFSDPPMRRTPMDKRDPGVGRPSRQRPRDPEPLDDAVGHLRARCRVRRGRDGHVGRGLGIARQYQRRNAFYDVGSRGAAALAVVCASRCSRPLVVPERYAAAREWADAARARVTVGAPLEQAFAEGGLRPVGGELRHRAARSARYGKSRRRASASSAPERSAKKPMARRTCCRSATSHRVAPCWTRPSSSRAGAFHRPITRAATVGRPVRRRPASGRSSRAGQRLPSRRRARQGRSDHADAEHPERGTRGVTHGQDFETTVTNALKRGASAVLYIDPKLPTVP